MTGRRGYVALGVAAACWGVTTPIEKYAVAGMGAFNVLAVEAVAAALVIFGIATARGVRPSVPQWRYALLGLVEPGVTFGALNLGLRYTPAATAALLDGLQPCFVLVFGALLLRERVSLRSGAGVAIATAGVALLVAWHATIRLGLSDALVLGGALAASLSVILVKWLAASAGTLELTSYQLGYGCLWCAPFAAIAWAARIEPVPDATDWRYLVAAVSAGLGALLVASLLYNAGVAVAPVGVAGITQSLIPVFGVAASALLLSEHISFTQIIGAVFILAGMAVFAGQ
jgi:drug/metabolite transporter (DMT)-like permease